jgi:aldehyde dehydrogenase (NAD+)
MWATDPALRARCLRQLQDSMRRHREEYRRALVAEIGCAVRMTYGDQLDRPIEKLGFYADLAEKYEYVVQVEGESGSRGDKHIFREPVGVVGAITPWNIPVELNLAKVGAALAAGCTVVLKPSPESPWSGTIMGRLAAEETDMPAGVLNVVPSSDHLLGAQLASDSRVDAIAFTGSTATGKKVMEAAAATIKKVMLELGGKSANVILDDVDLERTVPVAAAFVCFNAGQSCILPSRLLVPRGRVEDCVELAAEGLRNVPYGDPTDPGNFMGPLISERQRERVEGYVARGSGDGARLVVGGRRPADKGPGYYFEPTLFADVDPEAVIAQEEIFGPVLSVIAYDDDDDAVRIANGTVYGLAAYIWGGDAERALGIARRVRSGMVAVNGGSFIDAELPFGGRGQSGIGREWGVAGFEEFLEPKSVGVGSIG